MSTPYTGEIQLFGFNFAPFGWAQCLGQLLEITQNVNLFSLIGTSYGGNGSTTFMLPNFTNRAANSQGQGPGLSQRDIGVALGDNVVVLKTDEMPAHHHLATLFNQTDSSKRSGTPTSGGYLSAPRNSSTFPYTPPPTNTAFSPQTLALTGGSQPHENRQPLLALNFCIALQGIFPSPE